MRWCCCEPTIFGRYEDRQKIANLVSNDPRLVSSQEAQCWCGEVGDIGEDGREICCGYAEPLSECGPVLCNAGSRNEGSAAVGIVVSTGDERGERTIELSALHTASDDEVMITPRVIAAIVTAWSECAAEF